MTEKEIISKIHQLRQIKPSEDWVRLTKSQILGEGSEEMCSYGAKTAGLLKRFLFASFAFGTVAAIVIASQNSLPGDILYPVKKFTEKSQEIFVSKDDLPKYNLEIVNKRLEELSKIAQSNQVKKLAPAISEFKTEASEAAESLVKVKKPDVKNIVIQTEKLEKTKQHVEKVLATKIGTEELDNALAQLVENQIEEIEKRKLSDSQKDLLNKAKLDFENKRYSEALVKILILSQDNKNDN